MSRLLIIYESSDFCLSIHLIAHSANPVSISIVRPCDFHVGSYTIGLHLIWYLPPPLGWSVCSETVGSCLALPASLIRTDIFSCGFDGDLEAVRGP